MDNWQKEHEEFMRLIDETSKVLDAKLKSGEITQYEYDEVKSFDIECDEEIDPIKLFKEFYTERCKW